jgi:putative Holliday junction resolvase
MLPNPHSCIARTPEEKALAEISKIAKENNVKKIVVGIPINMDGTKGFQAENCEDFASKIKDYEIIFEDERLTSDTAEENLRNRKIDFRKNKGLVDIESACIILEQYLSRKN